MCVICIKKPGERFPTRKELDDMFSINRHGIGFVYARNGVLHIRKGYMSVDALSRALAREKVTTDDPLIIHFRLASCATVTPELTHPYPVNTAKYLLTATGVDLYGRHASALAHNGVMIGQNIEKGLTDTASFIRANYALLQRFVRNPDDQDLLAQLNALIGEANKLALMDVDGNIVTYGRFFQHNGLTYSNLHWVDFFTSDAVKTRSPSMVNLNRFYNGEWKKWGWENEL